MKYCCIALTFKDKLKEVKAAISVASTHAFSLFSLPLTSCLEIARSAASPSSFQRRRHQKWIIEVLQPFLRTLVQISAVVSHKRSRAQTGRYSLPHSTNFSLLIEADQSGQTFRGSLYRRYRESQSPASPFQGLQY